MKTAKEWADALIAARPSMTAGQYDAVDFADAFAVIIATIQEDARAAGYAEAIEKAAKVAGGERYAGKNWIGITESIAAEIRALAPAVLTPTERLIQAARTISKWWHRQDGEAHYREAMEELDAALTALDAARSKEKK